MNTVERLWRLPPVASSVNVVSTRGSSWLRSRFISRSARGSCESTYSADATSSWSCVYSGSKPGAPVPCSVRYPAPSLPSALDGTLVRIRPYPLQRGVGGLVINVHSALYASAYRCRPETRHARYKASAYWRLMFPFAYQVV